MAKRTSGKVLSFISKGQKPEDPEGNVIDHGKIGDLNYKVYARGVVHIFDNKLTFKKDPDLLEEALEDINFDTMTDGEEYTIPGSGDNDDLILVLDDGEIKLNLRKKEFGIVKKLRNIISRGKNNKTKQK